ncbi:MAG: hypothetical protein V3S05_05825 [Desulfobacterales bacterium]
MSKKKGSVAIFLFLDIPHKVYHPYDCGFTFESDKRINPPFSAKCVLLLCGTREMIHFTA